MPVTPIDPGRVNGRDIAVILAVVLMVPMPGNPVPAPLIDRARALLSSPARLARIDLISGALRIAAGAEIAVG